MMPNAMRILITMTIYLLSTQCNADDVTVNTTTGFVKGISEYVQGTKVDKYLGIPYAAPPLDDLRFKDPVPHLPWKETWNATKFAPFCAMAGFELEEQMSMSEDCLYLNVFVPEVFGGPMEGLPVVVLLGSLPLDLRPSGKLPVTEALMLDGSVLAAIESVIVVTVNYRRDMFGFLATNHPSSTGNYALKDQNMAMKWVKDNAAQFKGNPSQITLGGLVGGGAYVVMHMVSSASEGLFQRSFMTGIVSPYSDAVRKHYPGGGPAKTFAKELAQKVNCATDEDEDMISCLRKVTTENLINAGVSLYDEKYKNQTDGYWMFMDGMDGSFLTEDVTLLWEDGSYNNIPLLVAGEPVPMAADFGDIQEVTEDEYKAQIQRLVSSMPWQMPSQDNSYFQPVVEAAMYVYNNWTNGGKKMAQQIAMMQSDQRQAGQIKMLSVYGDNTKKNDTEEERIAYKYIFNYRSTNSPNPGIRMGDDVLYILGEPLKSNSWSLQDQQVSRLMMAFYGNFIYHGDPTHRSGISWWPVFDSTDQKYLEVNREGGTDIMQNYRKDKMSFWNQLRPMMLSKIEDIVMDVKQDSAKYDDYLETPADNGKDTGTDDKDKTDKDEKKVDDDDDMDKYFLATWILAGVGIILAIGIVVMICITYKAKAKAYTFEATKL